MTNPDFEDSDFQNSVIDYESDTNPRQEKPVSCATCGYGDRGFVGGHCPECNECYE